MGRGETPRQPHSFPDADAEGQRGRGGGPKVGPLAGGLRWRTAGPDSEAAAPGFALSPGVGVHFMIFL